MNRNWILLSAKKKSSSLHDLYLESASGLQGNLRLLNAFMLLSSYIILILILVTFQGDQARCSKCKIDKKQLIFKWRGKVFNDIYADRPPILRYPTKADQKKTGSYLSNHNSQLRGYITDICIAIDNKSIEMIDFKLTKNSKNIKDDLHRSMLMKTINSN